MNASSITAAQKPTYEHLKFQDRISNHFRRKPRLFILALGFSLAISACGTAEVSPNPQPPTPTRTAVKLGPTSTSLPATPTQPASEPTPTLVPLQPITENDWTRGAEEATVTIVVYSDFQ
jgi:hypothetical protein